MLKDRIKAVFDEPACPTNRAKSATARATGCSKPLTPGAAAGGCAFDGAKILLQPITDAAHLVHGALACEGNSWDNRGVGSSGSDLWRKSFTTDLTELDIVTGTGEKKLYRAIREIAQRFSPAAIFVYSTCVTALIGDDIDAVCRQAGAKYGLPVIPVPAAGFVGSKNLGNKLAGQALLDHVIGTVEPDDVGATDIVVLGEFNLSGEFWQVKPLLERIGVRVRTCIPGDARYRDIAAAHTARATMVVCSTALVGLARQMEERWGIPYFEGSFYGISDTSESLRRIAQLLMARGADAALLERTEALIAAEEARAWARLAPYRERLAGKRVLLNTGGVKSWSIVSALMELGVEIVGTSIKKSTEEDKLRVRLLMHEDARAFEGMAPRDLYAQLRDDGADIMLSGSRTQFIALKARTPWLDVNQERIHPYAGYEGTVELVRQIDLAIHNPMWAEVRTPPPWDAEGRPAPKSVRPSVSLPAESPNTRTGGDGEAGEGEVAVPDRADAVEPTFTARHHKKFAHSRVDNTDPEYLAHHRKKFVSRIADDMGEC